MKFSTAMAMKIPKISSSYDTSLEAWLAKTSYTEQQKQKFREIALESYTITKKDRKCKCFVKAETYPEYKFPRPIKSRTDRFKTVMGPIFQAINEQLFSMSEWFIKKTPVEQRAKKLAEILLPADFFDCTDYSSFEAHFIAMMIFAIEFPLYLWLIHDLPCAAEWEKELDTLLATNDCRFKDFTVWCRSRASGEMNTSSGNGWSNFIIFSYITEVKQATKTGKQFEGDDGVTKTEPRSSAPVTKDFEDLGWTCKLNTVTKFEEASFCGIVADINDMINVCDVRAYLADFGWTKQQYLDANQTTIMALIRAKGYSAVYQYPGCPIIDALGHYALRVTNYDTIQHKLEQMIRKGKIAESRYKADRMREMFSRMEYKIPQRKMTPPATRELVSRLFAIPLDSQISIETYLDNLTTIQHLNIDLDVPQAWRHCWDNYVGLDGFAPDHQREIQEFRKFISAFSSVVVDF